MFKASQGSSLKFESVSKDATIDFAQHYYSSHKVILNIDEFAYAPKDHTHDE